MSMTGLVVPVATLIRFEVPVVVWSPVFVPDDVPEPVKLVRLEVLEFARLPDPESVIPFTVVGVIVPRASVRAGVAPPEEEPLMPLAEVIVIAVTYVPAGCLPLKVDQSVLERYPLCVASAICWASDVPEPITAPVPPVTAMPSVPAAVRLPRVKEDCLLLKVVQSVEDR